MKPPNYHIRDLPEPPLPVVSTKATTKLLRKLQKRRGRSLTPTEAVFGRGRGRPPGRGKRVRARPCPYCGHQFGSAKWRTHVTRCDPRGPGPSGRRKQVAISASAPKIALCHYCQQPYGAWALDQHEVVCPMRPEVRQLTEE